MWIEGGDLDKQDKEISKSVVGAATLDMKLELVVSCFSLFGMPHFLLFGPLFLALFSSSGEGSVIMRILGFLVLVAAAGAVGYVWIKFCKGDRQIGMKYIFNLQGLVLPPLIGVFALIFGGDGWRVGAFHATSYFIGQLVIKMLKPKVGRLRPTACSELMKGLPARKITIIGDMLRHDRFSSFPSGDSAGAVAFAFPLALHGGLVGLVGAIIVVAGTFYSRMYFRAHHALDLAAGAGVGLVSHLLLRLVYSFERISWWQPIFALLVFTGINTMQRWRAK